MGSPETGTVQPRTLSHCAQQHRLCPQAQHTGHKNPRWPVLAAKDYGLPVFADTGGMGPFINI